jgi:hypothetical protein
LLLKWRAGCLRHTTPAPPVPLSRRCLIAGH